MFSSDEDILEEEIMMTTLSEDTQLIRSPTIRASFQTMNATSRAKEAPDKDSGSDDSEVVNVYTASRKSDEKLVLQSSNKSTCFLWLLSSFSAIGGFLFGYDTGVVSGAMLFLKDEFSLSSVWQEIVISVTIGAAFLSALAGGFLNDMFGRKVVTLVASFMFTVGAVMLGCALNVAMLVSGRVIIGIGIGLASMTVPVYIAESAPSNMRGRLVTINNLFITGGQFVASLMDGGFSYIKPGGWRYMLGLAGVPSAIQFCGFFFLPESPRWLMKKGREAEANDVLIKLRGVHSVDDELGEIREAVKAELNSQGGNNFIKILQTPSVRRALIVGCGLQLFQQFCGINTVMYYSATIINMSGVGDKNTAVWLAAMTSGINFAFTLIGVCLVERLGRRKLIIGSLIGVTASLIVLGVAFQLMAFNSPTVTEFDSAYVNFTCTKYRNCEACIENSDCGFCYTKRAGSINGSCLAVHTLETSHAEYGECKNESLPQGMLWSYGYCPTSYSWLAISGLLLYLMFFAPGMGPMPWTINSEIYPLWARSTGNSLSAATNWISNLVVSMTFLTLTETITKYGTYWLFSGIAILGLVFIGFCVPETKGRKLEEMDDLFSQPLCRFYSFSSTRPKYRSLEFEAPS